MSIREQLRSPSVAGSGGDERPADERGQDEHGGGPDAGDAVAVAYGRGRRIGKAAELDTRVPHWFGSADGKTVELLSLFGRQGERTHLRARARPRWQP
jgi:hypothetical protein